MLFSRSLLPGNATPLESALSEAFAEAFAGLPDPRSIPTALDPAACDVRLLPFLAWEWSVDEWQPEWPEAVKRATIAASWDVHAHKGTPYALQRALDPLGYGAQVTEWFLTARPAYTFRLAITDPANGEWRGAALDSLYRTTLRAKNVRSYLEATNLRLPGSQSPIFAGAMVRTRIRVRPNADPVTILSAIPPVFVGAMVRTRIRARPVA
ncbi:phage tail protein I [Xanthobacter sp. VTT E-85241]|uniref:phage tail protein I n=1 Tax=Roseixanthobacter finlandensis TaxID=3119922 RepID=UPI00372A1A40